MIADLSLSFLLVLLNGLMIYTLYRAVRAFLRCYGL